MPLKADLDEEVRVIFQSQWTQRDAQVVPDDNSLLLGNDGANLEATVLYADLSGSTALVDGQPKLFAAEVYKAFLRCAARIIRSEDGVITALEQGFELWEREIRRTVASVKSGGTHETSSPMDAWTENWRRATEAFTGGTGTIGEEARKQAETIQKTLQDGLRAWQKLWEPDKKS